MKSKTFIIAEAGVNHNGRIDTGLAMVDVAAEAGADAIKFQTYIPENLATPSACKAEYQIETTGNSGSQLEMLQKYALDREAHERLIERCRARKIEFISSAFDLESLDLLVSLQLTKYKIPSGEITNFPYLRKIGDLKREIILSTGMADIEEIKAALHVLEEAGTEKSAITLLHCNSAYPSPLEDINLRAMQNLKKIFDLRVGCSDHTTGLEVPIAAVALGAGMIEKHFTLDRNMTGPDHRASLDPTLLKDMVAAIRRTERILGSDQKTVTVSEKANLKLVRKSIVAARKIVKGEMFSEENLAVKRPATGINPMRWDEIVGQRAKRDYRKDEQI